MGNVALCAPSIISNGEVKIISGTGGRLLIYTKAPVKAAEIMLENPGQFLCESSNLKVGQRITGICAEEELEKRQVYFLLPMEMLYSVLTNEEMKFLTQKASKGMKQIVSLKFSKIFPEFNCLFNPNNNNNNNNRSQVVLHKAVDDGDSAETSNSVRFSRQRSWQPSLETIIETPPHA